MGTFGDLVQRKDTRRSGVSGAVRRADPLRDALVDPLVQLEAEATRARDPRSVHKLASDGVKSASGRLPHHERIQEAFGGHDLSGVAVARGGRTEGVLGKMGAKAYATGRKIALRTDASLHDEAHEAAHVVQQRGGVSLAGGVGRVGDPYEQHADAVADRVVAGRSASDLLGSTSGAGAGVQLAEDDDQGRDVGAHDDDQDVQKSEAQDDDVKRDDQHADQGQDQDQDQDVQKQDDDQEKSKVDEGGDQDQGRDHGDGDQDSQDKGEAQDEEQRRHDGR